MNPYETCPVYEDEHFCLRLVELSDVPDLLRVYSDEKAVPFFNGDNCHGDDFHYTTPERMADAVKFWRLAYEQRAFVRWTILDRRISGGTAVGTIELFNRRADDYYDNCGLLRLDLGSGYEQEEAIRAILSLIVPPAFDLFGCEMIATKIVPAASCRKAAAQALGFTACEKPLIGGDDKVSYYDYYVIFPPVCPLPRRTCSAAADAAQS